MIRPWYRSRFLWVCIPGLLFLLWGWWDSGGSFSRLEMEGPSLEQGVVDSDEGLIRLQIRRDKDPARKWNFSGWRDRITEEGFPINWFSPSTHAPRERQFDFPPGFRLEQERDEALGENPAAKGWVPSPGAKLPTPELKSIKVEIACWLLVLLYLVLWGSLLWLWQRRKVHLLRRSSTVS